jgi:hypothetical protein
VPGFSFVPVTTVAKEAGGSAGGGARAGAQPTEPRPAARAAYRGFSWGGVVHGALAVAAEETDPEVLRSAFRGLLVEHGRPLDDHGDPVELLELLDMVRAVRASDIWARAARAERRFTEIPLSLREGVTTRVAPVPTEPDARRGVAGSALRQLDLFAAPGPSEDPGVDPTGEPDADESLEVAQNGFARALEGVIDLVFEESDGWVVVDYKTDVGTDPRFEARMEGYRRQVDLYAGAWGSLTGGTVKERVLFFTTQGRVERW